MRPLEGMQRRMSGSQIMICFFAVNNVVVYVLRTMWILATSDATSDAASDE